MPTKPIFWWWTTRPGDCRSGGGSISQSEGFYHPQMRSGTAPRWRWCAPSPGSGYSGRDAPRYLRLYPLQPEIRKGNTYFPVLMLGQGGGLGQDHRADHRRGRLITKPFNPLELIAGQGPAPALYPLSNETDKSAGKSSTSNGLGHQPLHP